MNNKSGGSHEKLTGLFAAYFSLSFFMLFWNIKKKMALIAQRKNIKTIVEWPDDEAV